MKSRWSKLVITLTVASALYCELPVSSAQSSLVQGTTSVSGFTSVNLSLFTVSTNSRRIPSKSHCQYYLHPSSISSDAIDGVTLPLLWANIETQKPDTTPCVPAPSDTCQPDPIIPLYHHYTWTPYESLTYPGVWEWFQPVGSPAVGKKVNFLVYGIINGNPNAATPRYVTSSWWYNQFTTPYAPDPIYARQDVINSAICSSVPWTGTAPSSIGYATSTHTITINSSTTCCSTSSTDANLIQQGDLVWTAIPANSTCATGSGGQTVSAVNSSTSFSYAVSGCTAGTSISPTGATFISAFQSWPVPYEWPYKSALKALWAAVFAHFNAAYTADFGSGRVNVANQLGYVRPGESAGGEAFPYCLSTLSNASLTPAPYTFVKSAGTSGTTMGWLDYYREMLQWATLSTPYMTVFGPLNTANNDPDYGTQEAVMASSSSNGYGVIDGFGSQGLSILDTSAFNGCANAASDWCDSFVNLYGNGMARELQQISLSNEQNTTSCPGCGLPPTGNSGSLTKWLPFAVQNHLTVLELYTLDAALAFDPYYCATILGGNCLAGYPTTGTFLSGDPGTQATFMNDVGQGSNCPGGGSGAGGSSTGNCTYAACLEDAHGLHPRPQLVTSCMPY